MTKSLSSLTASNLDKLSAKRYPDGVVGRTSSTVMVTSVQAESWLKNCSYKRQRSIQTSRVNRIKHLMDTNVFRPHTLISFCEFGRERILVNGYHTLTAIAERGGFLLDVEVFEVDSEAAIDMMYASFDPEGSARGRNDINKALDVKSKLGISDGKFVDRVTVAVTWLINKFALGTVGVTKVEAAQQTELNYAKEAIACFDLATGRPQAVRTIITSSPVLAVMLFTFKHDRANALDFWRKVAENAGVTTYPPRALIECSLKLRARGGFEVDKHTAIRRLRPATSNDYVLLACHAYRKWKLGVDMVRGGPSASASVFETLKEVTALRRRTPSREDALSDMRTDA